MARLHSQRFLPDGTPLRNRLLSAMPADAYELAAKNLKMIDVTVGELLVEHGVPVRHVFFPNSGVYSVTNEMSDGRMAEIATVGAEGMLGFSVISGDTLGSGHALQQVPNGALPRMSVAHFLSHATAPGPFRFAVTRFAQAHYLQVMQCSACNLLHRIEQRCCRLLLQTHDRAGADEFKLKHEFLSIMLGSARPTVTAVLGTLVNRGLITSRYGRIRVIDRQKLEKTSCECYKVIAGHFRRLGV